MYIFRSNSGEGRDDLGPPPPPFRVYSGGRPRQLGQTERLLIVAGLVLVLFIASTVLRDIYTEWLWFGSTCYQSVYITMIQAKIGLFVIGLLSFILFIGVNF